MIPKAKFGKEATLEEACEEHPELKTKYPEFYNTAVALEDLVANIGIHAAGLVISDTPLHQQFPLWWKKTEEEQLDEDGYKLKLEKVITQYDMEEVQELGAIKFDFLGIDNLSVIKECTRLLAARGIHYTEEDVYSIPDGDKKAYALLGSGCLTGIFQMETSGSAKNLLLAVKPRSIEEISDISSLNRPGPMTAGLDTQYIECKNSGTPPSDMPEPLRKILESTYWTLVYQEQIMEIVHKLGGLTLREADDVRRALGKKKKEVLEPWKVRIFDGLMKQPGFTKAYTEKFWEDLLGYADYCFNKSHSVN